ncbi:hypothetical protein GHK92_04115 [Nocardioides sp. dk4132]|uniref:hypothetical protein n=1 Tax=unclassified Nocardioides TaxID=2615069 RepID=UPI001294CE8B|nr:MULTISPECIES: hypothetical protein [unclassified Nocardioides]MQW75048.1 hypothetical protein [Nocardioides sp. dk4132]QGA07779.1 hypothetical protein GFH29_10495 [Nocardioides sp. dk884]
MKPLFQLTLAAALLAATSALAPSGVTATGSPTPAAAARAATDPLVRTASVRRDCAKETGRKARREAAAASRAGGTSGTARTRATACR